MTQEAVSPTQPKKSSIPAGLSDVLAATEITQVDTLKLVIMGEPGAGKSWLTCTARPPILVCDFDDRKLSIAGKPGVFIKTYVDRDPKSPHAWNEFESDLGTLEYAKQKGTLEFKTIAIASLTYMLKYAQHQMMKDQTGLCRKIRVNSVEYLSTVGWDAVTVAQKMIEGVLNRLFELKLDVIVEAHIRREKDPASTPDKTIYTDKYTVEPQNLKMLLPSFNERWLVLNDYGEYKVITKPNSIFNAITALHIDGEEECNIQKILAKHTANVAAGK